MFSFLEKYTEDSICHCILQNKNADNCYEDVMKIIKNYITGKKICKSINESTDT